MKKNAMMRLASVLLIAVMISTSAISGTYAKYVTSDEGSDSARVAKFGVVVEIDETMFSDSYKNEATDYTENEEGLDITVQADAADTNVVAPGTKGSLAGFTVTGTPEVDVAVTYTATLTLDKWEVAGNEYCPIIITVNNEDYYVGKEGIADVAGLKTAVEEAIVAEAANYDTNTDLTAVDDDLNVSWRWEFEHGTVPAQTDALDTKLGDQAAAGNAATIQLAVGMTVTQIY